MEQVKQIPDASALSGVTWTKSSYSGEGGGQCVAIARLDGGIVAAMDTKDPTGPAFILSPEEFRSLKTAALETVKL